MKKQLHLARRKCASPSFEVNQDLIQDYAFNQLSKFDKITLIPVRDVRYHYAINLHFTGPQKISELDCNMLLPISDKKDQYPGLSLRLQVLELLLQPVSEYSGKLTASQRIV